MDESPDPYNIPGLTVIFCSPFTWQCNHCLIYLYRLNHAIRHSRTCRKAPEDTNVNHDHEEAILYPHFEVTQDAVAAEAPEPMDVANGDDLLPPGVHIEEFLDLREDDVLILNGNAVAGT